ncbi:MAG: hypothetical protein FWD60_10765 [Candidatus Azobacteroides sp.]|nr:hypothetical protein [Candidatus Azobacteroides sp.]
MKKNILTTSAIIIATVSAFSQSVTETRHIKTTALQVYENYKVVMSGLHSKSSYTEDNFMTLFDKNTTLYNDILPDNNPQQLSPANYFAKFKASINRIYPDFSDFKMEEPVSVGDKWQIKCNFTRGTRFKTLKDMNYPEWSFNYTMTIEMDKRYDTNKKVYENARIESIDVENPLKGFFVLENKDNMLLTAKSGETLKEWDAEYNSRIFPEDEWKIKDIQVFDSGSNKNFFEYSKSRFSQNRSDTHFYQLATQTFPKNIYGIGVNCSPFAFGKNTKNYAISLSLFYGKQIAHKERSTIFFNVGLDFNCYSDNNDKFISVSVPLSVQYLYQLSQNSKKPIFLSFELGAFGECTMDIQKKLKIGDTKLDRGILGGIGFWTVLNESNMLKFNVSYKYGSYSRQSNGMQIAGFGISWVKTIGRKK